MADTASPRHRLAALLLLAAGALGLGACSCLTAARVVGIYQHEDGIVAQVDSDPDSPSEPLLLYLSGDGGRTWNIADPANLGTDEVSSAPTSTPTVDEPADAEADFVDGGGDADEDDTGATQPLDQQTQEGLADPLSVPTIETEDCLQGGRCFRVVPGREVQEQIDGSWVTAFAFTDEQLSRMDLRSNGCGAEGRDEHFFSSLAIVDLDDGTRYDDTVIVSMGGQGLLRLDRVTDTWDRVAVGDRSPVATWGPRWLDRLVFTPLIALVLAPVLLALNRRGSSIGRRLGSLGISVGLLAGLTCTVLFLALLGFDYAIVGILSALATVAVVLFGLAIVLPKERSRGTPPPVPVDGGSAPPWPARSDR